LSKLLSKIKKRKKLKQGAATENRANTEETKGEEYVKGGKHSPKKCKPKVDEVEEEDKNKFSNVSQGLDNSPLPRVKRKSRRSHETDQSLEALPEADISAQDTNGLDTVVKEEVEDTNQEIANESGTLKKSRRKKKPVRNGDGEKFTTLGEQAVAPKRKNKQKVCIVSQ